MLALSLGQLTCGGTDVGKQKVNGNTQVATSGSPATTPSVPARSMLPQSIGGYELEQTVDLKEIEQKIPKAIDGAGSIYYSANTGGTVQYLVVYFPSSKDAYDELQAALQRYRLVNKDVKLAVIKNERGEQVGQQLLMRDEMVEAVHWTNGSLYCIAQSETKSALDFAKKLPYYYAPETELRSTQ